MCEQLADRTFRAVGGSGSGDPQTPWTSNIDGGSYDLTTTGDVTAESFLSTGGANADYGVLIDQTVGTPTACPANFVCIRNDDGVMKHQIGSTLMTFVKQSAQIIDPAQDSAGQIQLRFYEDVDDGSNKVTLRGTKAATAMGADATRTLLRIPEAQVSVGIVAGGISDDGVTDLRDTPEKLCDTAWGNTSTGVEATCLANTAKSYDPTTAVATWVTCSTEVAVDTYFETLCVVP